MTSTLDVFSRDLVQDVLATAEATATTLPEAFTQRLIEHLAEAGELDDGIVCYFRSLGMEISGYAVAEDDLQVDVFISHFRNDVDLPTLSASEATRLFRRLRSFLDKCAAGRLTEVDDSWPAYDMVLDVTRALKSATRVRLFLFTNCTCKNFKTERNMEGDVEYSTNLWDVARLHRLLTSGSLHEPIVVDFQALSGSPLPCLSTPVVDGDYSALLAIIPGSVLAKLYAEYGTRLLELNVRSFLQAKGAVNRGIRETLVKNPERFLAYNNGISATASKIEMVDRDGSKGILRLHDLQVVNGGQTTASIYAAAQRDGADMSKVLVQAKITVVSPERIQDIVPAISRFSNTQNKVTTADFSSNDSFHVEVEKLSRSVWAPSPTGDGQETHWFYERARGQYADELSRQRTPARVRAWKVANPTRQKFTKTDLAKYVATWDQYPYLVSRGAEKNFREYMVRMSANGRPTVDLIFFHRLVAKAILFKESDRIVSMKNFGGYKANVVTYTISKVANETKATVDLDAIWKRQGLTPALEAAIADLSEAVHKSITSPPGGANIGEWCKRPECWARVQSIPWRVPAALAEELVDQRTLRVHDAEFAAQGQEGEQDPDVVSAAAVASQTWFDVAQWAKQTGSLQPWQRGLAYSLGQRAERSVLPTIKQARQGLVLLEEATRLGFRPEQAASDMS
jgi:hypothetical protein